MRLRGGDAQMAPGPRRPDCSEAVAQGGHHRAVAGWRLILARAWRLVATTGGELLAKPALQRLEMLVGVGDGGARCFDGLAEVGLQER